MNRQRVNIARHPISRRRRGVIFIAALGIVVVLTGLVLVYAQAMHSEAIASANVRSNLQADAVELGAEQWVMAQCDAYTTDAMTVTSVPADTLQVGDGYFWILSQDGQNTSDYQFGIVDELSKLDINNATVAQIQLLPADISSDLAQAIVDWRVTGGGNEATYYQALPEPYESKGYPYESVEEMLLVEGVTPQLLWGIDMNRNGVIEDSESSAAGGTSSLSSGYDPRGIFNYVTCFALHSSARTAGNFQINPNTAPEAVLMCLPGVQQSDADAIISARQGQDYTDFSWVQNVVPSLYGGPAGIQRYLNSQAKRYSADIVAVSGDGRAFKRVRIVVDCQSTPSKIIYRKDLTSFGWPLDPAIRATLRAGGKLQTPAS